MQHRRQAFSFPNAHSASSLQTTPLLHWMACAALDRRPPLPAYLPSASRISPSAATHSLSCVISAGAAKSPARVKASDICSCK
jgi:hypothetical protein